MEVNGNKKPLNKPGVYVHKESGAELLVRSHPKFGSAQADALVRVGYEFKSEAPKKATKEKTAPVKDDLAQAQEAAKKQKALDDERVALEAEREAIAKEREQFEAEKARVKAEEEAKAKDEASAPKATKQKEDK